MSTEICCSLLMHYYALLLLVIFWCGIMMKVYICISLYRTDRESGPLMGFFREIVPSTVLIFWISKLWINLNPPGYLVITKIRPVVTCAYMYSRCTRACFLGTRHHRCSFIFLGKSDSLSIWKTGIILALCNLPYGIIIQPISVVREDRRNASVYAKSLWPCGVAFNSINVWNNLYFTAIHADL